MVLSIGILKYIAVKSLNDGIVTVTIVEVAFETLVINSINATVLIHFLEILPQEYIFQYILQPTDETEFLNGHSSPTKFSTLLQYNSYLFETPCLQKSHSYLNKPAPDNDNIANDNLTMITYQ